jgi:hypothetical protein
VNESPKIEEIEEKVAELDRLADSLGDAPDAEVIPRLDRAVELLEEVNAGIEAALRASEQGSREAGTLLEGVDFGPFDAALRELEERERTGEEA